MSNKRKYILWGIMILLLTAGLIAFTTRTNPTDKQIISYTVDPQKQDLQLYWKDDRDSILRSIQNLKTYLLLKNQILTFAMNAGMFDKDRRPLGL